MPETLEDYDIILTLSGYKEYQKSSMTHDATAFYQKRISDEKGVKFFIDCYLYEHERHPINAEVSTQFKGTEATYNLMEFAKDTFDLAGTELLLLTLWQAGNFNYSKIWGE